MASSDIQEDPSERIAREELCAQGIYATKNISLLVLSHLANLEAPITVPELTKLTGIHRASLYRTMESMEAEGWLVSKGQPRRYSLTYRFAQLGLRALRHNQVRQTLMPFATDLALQLRTPTNLSFYEDGHAVVTDSIALQNEIAVAFAEGVRIPATCSGPGKILLALQQPEELDRVLRQPIPKYTERTKTDPEEVRAELEITKERGYGWAFGEYGHRLGTVGLAVHDRTGGVTASIGFIVGRTYEGPPPEWLEIAHAICERASAQLGYRAPFFSS
jgi:DNA-binding IclR family transcriptional regulator